MIDKEILENVRVWYQEGLDDGIKKQRQNEQKFIDELKYFIKDNQEEKECNYILEKIDRACKEYNLGTNQSQVSTGHDVEVSKGVHNPNRSLSTSYKPETLPDSFNSEVNNQRGCGKEVNKANNVRNALEHNMFTLDSDFILMDSDVILPPDSIREVNEALNNYPVVTIPTKPGHKREDFPNVMPHALMAIRSELVEEFKKYLYKDGCFVCAFLKDYKPFVLWNCRGSEV